MMILLSVALVTDLPAAVQRALPDYTASLQAKTDEALETWWEISPTPLTNEQMNAELKKRGGAR